MINLTIDKIKGIKQLQDNIKLEIKYKTKRKNHYRLSKYSLPIVFLRVILAGNLSLKYADKEQTKIVNKLSDINEDKIPVERSLFQTT